MSVVDNVLCPECGNKESVLQSVTSHEWECLVELGGCGSMFGPPGATAHHQHTIHDAVHSMSDAICQFERETFPLGQPSLQHIERRTAKLLRILKDELSRLETLID
jgi:hypothetical protein